MPRYTQHMSGAARSRGVCRIPGPDVRRPVPGRPQRGTLLLDGPYLATDGYHYYLCTLANIDMLFRHVTWLPIAAKNGEAKRKKSTTVQPITACFPAEGLCLTRTFCIRDSCICALSQTLTQYFADRVVLHPKAKPTCCSALEAMITTCGRFAGWFGVSSSATDDLYPSHAQMAPIPSGSANPERAAAAASLSSSSSLPATSVHTARRAELLAFLASVLDDTEGLLRIPVVGGFFMQTMGSAAVTLEGVPGSVVATHASVIPAALQSEWRKRIHIASTLPEERAASAVGMARSSVAGGSGVSWPSNHQECVRVGFKTMTPTADDSRTEDGHGGEPLFTLPLGTDDDDAVATWHAHHDDSSAADGLSMWQTGSPFTARLNGLSGTFTVPEVKAAAALAAHWTTLHAQVAAAKTAADSVLFAAVEPASLSMGLARGDPFLQPTARVCLDRAASIIETVHHVLVDLVRSANVTATTEVLAANQMEPNGYDVGSSTLGQEVPGVGHRTQPLPVAAIITEMQRRRVRNGGAARHRAERLIREATCLATDVATRGAGSGGASFPAVLGQRSIALVPESTWWDAARRSVAMLRQPSRRPWQPITTAFAAHCLCGSSATGEGVATTRLAAYDVRKEVAVLAAEFEQLVMRRSLRLLDRIQDATRPSSYY